MSGYVYLIRKGKYVPGDNVYKVGLTTQTDFSRFKDTDYDRHNMEIYSYIPVSDCRYVESKIKNLFNIKYQLVTTDNNPTESYRGNIHDMIVDFLRIASSYRCHLDGNNTSKKYIECKNSINAFRLYTVESAIRGKLVNETDFVRNESGIIIANTCYVNANGELELRQMYDYELDTMYNTYLWYCNMRNVQPETKEKFICNFGKVTEVNKKYIINDGVCRIHKWKNSKDRRFRYYFTPGHCIERENMYDKELDDEYANNEEIPIPEGSNILYKTNLINESARNIVTEKEKSNSIADTSIPPKIDKDYNRRIKLFLKLKGENKERSKRMYMIETDPSNIAQMEELLSEEEFEEFYLFKNNI